MWALQATTSKHPKNHRATCKQFIQEVLKSTSQQNLFDRPEKCFLRSVIICVSYFCRFNLQLIIPFSRLFLFSELAKWVYQMVWIDLHLFEPLSLSLNHLNRFSVSKSDIIKMLKKTEQIALGEVEIHLQTIETKGYFLRGNWEFRYRCVK